MESQAKETKEIRTTRSRSKTPGLVLREKADKTVNGDSDSSKAADKKSTKVHTVTIIEEELNSSQKSTATESGTGARSTRQARTVTSDYSSDDVSPDKAALKQSAKLITITTSSSTATTASSASKSNQPSKSSPDKKEVRQNEINRVLEKSQTAILRTSTPKASSKTAKTVTLTSDELKQHAAYKEYKEAGEYWNKFPKTDYTYSELSPHRREILPGVVAMPNMSRPGLSKHGERVNVMIQRNPAQETYIRQRYASSKYSSGGVSGGSFAHADPYDSGEEQLDLSHVSKSNSYRNSYWKSSVTSQVQIEHQSIVHRFFLAIVNFFYSSVHSVSRVFNRSEHNLYYTRIEDERGFFVKMYAFFTSLTTSIFKKVYLLISSVLFLDTWLLQTAASDVQQGRRKRKFLLLLLILLPFLLFGAYLLADEDQTIVLPASKRASFALSSLSNVLPSMSGEDFDRFKANLFQKLDWRESSFSWRSLLPSFSFSFWTFSGSGSQYEKLRSNLQNTLSREEYDSLMQHIDAYIEGLLTEKYLQKEQREAQAKQRLSPEVTLHIANMVQQNLREYNYKLSQDDVDHVAEKVRIELLASYPNVFSRDTAEKDDRTKREATVEVSKETLVELQRLIKQEISITNNNFVISDQQLEEVLLKILSSSRLVELIDSRVLLQTKDSKKQHESQAALIENLKNEITEIKTHFTEKLLASSLMVEDNLKSLRENQDRIADQVHSYRIENDEKYVRLLASIDERLAAAQQEQFAGLNTIIKKNIITILGLNVQEDFTDEDLKTWISNLFVAKDYLESRLKEYQEGVSALIQQEMERSAVTLMKDISEKIQTEVLASIQSFKNEVNIDAKAGGIPSENGGSGGGITEDHVRRIVRDALRIYDADKTGLVDYALESAGGQILSTRCTESYQTHSAQISIFGIPLWYPTNTPRTVISPTMQPGQCWAFSGFPGYLVIQLNSDVLVTGFSLEHISKLLAPNGQIDSAPMNFSVWGLANENDPHPILLGNYVYEDNGAALQYFPVDNPNRRELRGRAFRIVELRIESNHGNENYTCLYRFRVHGERL
ncbi:klaroid protein-like [Topomyia yanbarensis]|uniref:klaroid protein-like n=1 Tax=Topomyia yanbarensis TaxID=2498891 RepID=UPI00273B5B3A|nr:klaroid protein-like [Topomyia yanbarensis]